MLSMTEIGSDKTMTVSDHGAIACINIPAGWHKTSEIEHDTLDGKWASQAISKDFAPNTGEPATFSIYYRGSELGQSAANKFKEVIHAPYHSLQENELSELAQVLGNLLDDEAFAIARIHSTSISGRRAIVIEGQWKRSKTKYYGLMVNVDKDARVIQEIFFEAAPALFDSYIDSIKASIFGIEWKEEI